MVVKTRQLNLGCGETILDGYENYDFFNKKRKIK